MKTSKKMENLISKELPQMAHLNDGIADFGNPYRYAEAQEQAKELEKYENPRKNKISPSYQNGL